MIPYHSPTERQSMATALRSGISYPQQGYSELSPLPSTELLGTYFPTNYTTDFTKLCICQLMQRSDKTKSKAVGSMSVWLSKSHGHCLMSVELGERFGGLADNHKLPVFNQDCQKEKGEGPCSSRASNGTCPTNSSLDSGNLSTHPILEDSKPSLLGWGGVNFNAQGNQSGRKIKWE